jgi:hypothetical protein
MPLMPARPVLTLLTIAAIPNTLVAQPCPIGGAFGFAEPTLGTYLFESGHAKLEDLNGDGILDAFGDLSDLYGIAVRYGNADGTFDDPIVSPGNEQYRSICTGDLDGDGFTDLIATQNGLDRQLVLFRNDGTGGFENPVVFDIPNLGVEIRSPTIDVGDLDGDGGLDLVVALASGANRGYVFWQDSITRTYSSDAYFRFNVVRPSFPTVADIDGDGNDDIAYWGYPDDSGVLWNDGNRSFTMQNFEPAALLPVDDINNDGRADLVGIGPLTVYESDPLTPRMFHTRPITSAPSNPVPLSEFSPRPAVVAADIDQDGDNDLVFGERTIGVLRNRETLGYQFSGRYYRDFYEFGQAVGAADYDNDGMPDLVAVSNNAFLLRNLCTPALPCPADLAPPEGVLDLADIGAFVGAFTTGDPAADLNPDGVFDLADIAAFVTSFNTGCL